MAPPRRDIPCSCRQTLKCWKPCDLGWVNQMDQRLSVGLSVMRLTKRKRPAFAKLCEKLPTYQPSP